MSFSSLEAENDRLRAQLTASEMELKRLREQAAGQGQSLPTHASHERLFAVLGMLPGYMCLLRDDHSFAFVNQRFIDQFGDPGDRKCYEALFDRSEPCDDCRSFDCLSEGKPVRWEWNAPTGAIYEVFDYPFVDTDGSQLVLEVGFDITDRKRDTDELRRYRDSLQRMVADRTSELARQHELLEAFFSTNLTCVALLDRDFNFVRVNEAYATAAGRSAQDFPGLNHFDLYPSSSEALFRQVLETKEPYHATALAFEYPDDPGRGTTYWDWSLVPVLDQRGDVDSLFLCLHDVTQRTRAEEQNRAIIELLQLVNLAPDLEQLASGLVAHLRQWTGCEAAAVRIRQGDDFPFLAAEGFPPDLLAAENSLCALNERGEILRSKDGAPVLECVCGCVLCHKLSSSKPYLTEHGSFCVNSSNRFLAEHEQNLPDHMRGRCVENGYESIAIVPLRLQDEPFGLLHLCDRRKGVFDESTMLVLERLADSLAIALAHQAAQEELRRHERSLRALASRLAMTEEQQRLRIATVLHDDLCQTLGYTKMKLGAFRGQDVPEPLRELATEISQHIGEAIDFARNLTLDLSPPVLQKFGLAAALQWLADREGSRHNITVDCECPDQCDLDPEMNTVLFRSVRELLTNVGKYAQATQARIWLRCAGDAIVVGVADNGVGFQPGGGSGTGETGGFGLFSIRESLAQLGGSLQVRSAPGEGTECVLTVPLEP